MSLVHTAGITSNVSTVEASKPEIMAHAIGGHSVELESANGNSPATVVAVVSRMGRVRRSTAVRTASRIALPFSSSRSITSSSTMALFTTMPTSAITPNNDWKPKGEPRYRVVDYVG